MIMKKLSIVLIIASIAFVFNSCKKAEEDNDTQSAVDNSICEGEFMSIPPLINSIGIDEEGLSTKGGGCPSKSLSQYKKFPTTLTIDYGTGCQDSIENKFRKGKIKALFSGPWDTTTASVTISFENYYVNNINFDGVIVISKKGMALTTTVTDAKCKTSDFEIKWSATRTISWIDGFKTLKDKTDDVFTYAGNSSGTNRDGKKYTSEIITTLVKRNSCQWIESGIVKIVPEGKAERSVNYGDGTCDDKATLTINGNTFNFSLK